MAPSPSPPTRSGRAGSLNRTHMAQTLYEMLGGVDACRKLSAAFYARVARDPVLRPIFPSSFHCAIEALALFLADILGGPGEYGRQRWFLSLRESHQRFRIGPRERSAWLENMRNALDDVEISEPVRSELHWFFEQASAYIVNDDLPALAQRWDTQRELEEAISAARQGDTNKAIALAESSVLQIYFRRDRAGFLSFLVLMSGIEAGYVRRKVLDDPELVRDRYTHDRTLLHGAAAEGGLATVELLLQLGADPNATDKFGHTPLYCVANECGKECGPDVVYALAQGGANLDARDNVKRCTALHMAARRGNVGMAEALLNTGADIEARDSQGDTPLRRAVNCAKIEVAKLLIGKGADVHSKGSQGRTPWEAARSNAMKVLLKP